MFAQAIINTTQFTAFISGVTNAMKDNFLVVLGIVAFICGLSVVLALFDQATENRRLDNYAKLWRRR